MVMKRLFRHIILVFLLFFIIGCAKSFDPDKSPVIDLCTPPEASEDPFNQVEFLRVTVLNQDGTQYTEAQFPKVYNERDQYLFYNKILPPKGIVKIYVDGFKSKSLTAQGQSSYFEVKENARICVCFVLKKELSLCQNKTCKVVEKELDGGLKEEVCEFNE